MVYTSLLWKNTFGCTRTNNRPPFLPISNVEITYGVGDEHARTTATVGANSEDGISETSKITSGETSGFAKYITLEQDTWKLGGGYAAIEDLASSDKQYIGHDLSGQNGEFATHPIITLTWGSRQEIAIPGLTIQWSSAFNQYAKSFEVRAYYNATLRGSKTITDNDQIKCQVDLAITNYNKLEIEIIEWSNPQCKPRLESVLMGVYYIFDKTQLISYKHKASASELSLELPNNSITFEVDNTNDEWNPMNPQGKAQYLKEMQKVSVRYGIDLETGWEWIKGGEFYLSSWNTPQNGHTVTFEARSILEKCYGVKPTITGTMTLAQAIDSMLTSCNLPKNPDGTNKWKIDSSLESISQTTPSISDNNVAQALLMCANAGCCTFHIDRNGDLIFQPLTLTWDNYLIDPFVAYNYADYETEKPISKVSVNKSQGTSTYPVEGVEKQITNPFVRTTTRANAVAKWVGDLLQLRNKLSGDFRIDPRLDVFDQIEVKNKYSEHTIVITSVDIEYNGGFKGSYKGRVDLSV